MIDCRIVADQLKTAFDNRFRVTRNCLVSRCTQPGLTRQLRVTREQLPNASYIRLLRVIRFCITSGCVFINSLNPYTGTFNLQRFFYTYVTRLVTTPEGKARWLWMVWPG